MICIRCGGRIADIIVINRKSLLLRRTVILLAINILFVRNLWCNTLFNVAFVEVEQQPYIIISRVQQHNIWLRPLLEFSLRNNPVLSLVELCT